MPDPRDSPTVRRRQLAAYLQQLREERGLSVEAVAAEFAWSPGKVRYLESRRAKRPNLTDVQALLRLYEVDDKREIEFVTDLARKSRERTWWNAFGDQISEVYSTYIGLEQGAAAVFDWELGMIPGLCQTEEYARELISTGGKSDLKAIEDRVQVRMRRQEVLTRNDPLQLWAVMDEGALRRRVVSEDVMRGQMRRLIELADLPNVNILVVRFEAGAHGGGTGSFSILRFDEADDPPAVYVETPAGELFIEKGAEVQRFTDASQRLLALADSPGDTLALLADLAG